MADQQIGLSEIISAGATFALGLAGREGWRIRGYLFSIWTKFHAFLEFVDRFRNEFKRHLDDGLHALQKLKSTMSDEQAKRAISDLEGVLENLKKLADDTVITEPSKEMKL